MEDLTYQVTFVIAETIRATCEYVAFDTTSGIAPPLTLILSNILKLTIAIICLSLRYQEPSRPGRWFRDVKWKEEIFPFAIPALLDLCTTLIYFAALRFTSPYLLQAFMLVSVPVTAIAHHFWVQEQQNTFAWSSMAWLCLGLAMAKVPAVIEATNFVQRLTAIIAGCLIGILCAASSIKSETLLKRGGFWESQFRLYLWGLFISILSFPLTTMIGTWGSFGTMRTGTQDDLATYLFTSTLLAIFTAGVGIIVAVILRRRDNLVKLMGTSTSTVTSSILLNYTSTTLQVSRETDWSNFGYLLTAASVWLYSRYKSLEESSHDTLWTKEYEAVPFEEPPFDSEPANEELDEAQHSHPERHPDLDMVSIHQQGKSRKAILGPIFNAMTFGTVQKIALSDSWTIKSSSLSVLIFLLPSFIPLGKRRNNPLPAKKTHPTEYLDGVRGFAAFFVYFFHSISLWHIRSLLGWNGTTQNLFIQLPWIRLIVSGNAMVAIFFVVSGFSLAYGPLQRIRSKDLDGFLASLTSSVSRRWVRLFLPAGALTLLVMLLVHFAHDNRTIIGVGLPSSLPLQEQAAQWLEDFLELANPFHNINLVDALSMGSIFAATVWTLPIEFRGSMAVYLLLLGCAKIQSKTRLRLITGITLYCIYYLHWDLALFLSGVVLADLHLGRGESNTQSALSQGLSILFEGALVDTTCPKRAKMWVIVKNLFWILNFVLGTYILSTPVRIPYAHGEGDPGYVFLWSLTPTRYLHSAAWDRFWPMIGSIYVVFVIDNCQFLQALFTLRFSKYLGFISFGLYLVHLPMINTIGDMVIHKLLALTTLRTGGATVTGSWMAFGVGYVMVLLGVFWVADIFSRAIDQPSVRLSKWLYGRLLDGKIRI